jgi:hypothetical protein
MRKIVIGIIVLISIFLIGVFSTQFFIKPYFFPKWQGDNDSSCDKKIRNPLCSYSVDLHEIQTVEFSDLVQNPRFYNEKIIRLKGRYYNELNSSNSYLSDINNSNGQQIINVASYWNNKVNQTLCHFIDVNAPETNQSEVSLIVQFYDVSNRPSYKEIYNNNALQITILRVEEMKPVLGSLGNQNLQPRQHKEKFCNRRESQIDF